MCITSETCRADSVIKTAQNNLHQAGPNKTHSYTKVLFPATAQNLDLALLHVSATTWPSSVSYNITKTQAAYRVSVNGKHIKASIIQESIVVQYYLKLRRLI